MEKWPIKRSLPAIPWGWDGMGMGMIISKVFKFLGDSHTMATLLEHITVNHDHL